MVRVLSRGNRIKVIHTVSRNLDEMLEAIRQWMPLYMSGLIESYFYPKKRDGIFRRTLFIAPLTGAVVSSSTGNQYLSAANTLYREPQAIASFAEEFLQYLHMCRPLMRIFTAKERENCIAALSEFERERANALVQTESLSSLTMPKSVLLKILERAGADVPDRDALYDARYRDFTENLKSHSFTELISLPDIEAVKEGSVKVSLSDMLNGEGLYYTQEEFASHLENIAELLGAFENYHIHLTKTLPEAAYTVYAKEETGVVVAKASMPSGVIFVNESNVTAAFWDFLKSMVDEKAYKEADNSASISMLRSYLAELKER